MASSCTCSTALKLTEHRNAMGSILGCRPAFLSFLKFICLEILVVLEIEISVCTAGWINDATLEQSVPGWKPARVALLQF
jgi:hypothetical protein